ncbi:PREDICTED: uncharacterized protein LOC108660987 [Theobroma cacao]|uniref:Uncharacterized protein LOC108660987 n=1 Tax=Theobroma cacao TaxID=3641 RepID=A0AB32VXA9_THECC|nr:PREDICTED: uncharacterized protein LOC108660987 [Theobroma cacao]
MVGTTFRDWCRYFQYKEGANEEDRDKNRADARNALLVVATLIATVTFQDGVNPPGGVWQDNEDNQTAVAANPPVAVWQDTKDRIPGTAIFASDSSAYYVFLTSNTLAFSAAVLVIMSLTHNFPFKFEVRVACVSMIITYGSAIFAVTRDGDKFQLALIIAAAPLILRCLIQLLVKLVNRKPEPPCLIQAFVGPRNKTAEPPKDQTQQAKP